jgi:hypothetical protein
MRAGRKVKGKGVDGLGVKVTDGKTTRRTKDKGPSAVLHHKPPTVTLHHIMSCYQLLHAGCVRLGRTGDGMGWMRVMR